jgi:hypothetical protein
MLLAFTKVAEWLFAAYVNERYKPLPPAEKSHVVDI